LRHTVLVQVHIWSLHLKVQLLYQITYQVKHVHINYYESKCLKYCPSVFKQARSHPCHWSIALSMTCCHRRAFRHHFRSAMVIMGMRYARSCMTPQIYSQLDSGGTVWWPQCVTWPRPEVPRCHELSTTSTFSCCKFLQGKVWTYKTRCGGRCTPVCFTFPVVCDNLVRCDPVLSILAKNWQNRIISDKDIIKLKRVMFFSKTQCIYTVLYL